MDIAELLIETKEYFSQQKEIFGSDIYGLVNQVPQKITAATDDVLPSQKMPSDHSVPDFCAGCPLRGGNNNRLMGQGPIRVELMVVGGVPGKVDLQKNRSFSGQIGDLTNKILAAIGFKYQNIFFTNVLKCRTPAGRQPVQDEILACRNFLDQQINSRQPKMILAFGSVAAGALIKTSTFDQIRGNVFKYMDVPVIVTYHPGLLLVKPEYKKAVWADVQKLRSYYDTIAGDRP